MTRLIRKRVILLGASISAVVLIAFILTALSGRMVKAYLEKGSNRNFKVERISFGWGTIKGHGVQILSNGHEVARAKLIAIRPSLMTLFRKGYTLSRILLEEPTLSFTIDEKSNITGPLSGNTPAGQPSERQPFRVGLLQMKNGILTVDDRRPGSPAQSQIHNLNLSIGSISYPFVDSSSSLNASGQLSGKILSALISASGKVNLKTGTAKLTCTAQDLDALRHDASNPQIHITRLSFNVESQGTMPVTVREVLIEKPYYRYASQQKREIVRALPTLPSEKQPHQVQTSRRIAFIKGITVKGGEVVVMHGGDGKNPSSVTIVDMSLTLDQLALPLDTTPSFFDLSGHIPGRQNTANLRWSGTTSLGSLETDSRLSLQSLDLTILESYLEQKGEIVVTGGTVDVGAHVRIHNRYLDTPVTATIRHLQLAPAKGLKDQFMGVPRSMLLDSMKTKNGEIQINFVVSGSVDSPNFNLQESLTKRFAIALARTLGLSSVVGAGESVVQQGARALQGAGKGIGGLGEGVKRLFGK